MTYRPERLFDVFSEKYHVTGCVFPSGAYTVLVFEWDGRQHVIGLSNGLQMSKEAVALKTMECAIEKLLQTNVRKTMLHYWYVDYPNDPSVPKAHGIVTGHPKWNDTIPIHTSKVLSMAFCADTEEMNIRTLNTDYYCPVRYWNFEKQDQCRDAIDRLFDYYSELRAKYMDQGVPYPTIEPGNVLLVFSDFDEYYFHSLSAPLSDGAERKYKAYPHIGTFQDSFLIHSRTDRLFYDGDIDIRYFPHYRHIEFYSTDTGGMPLFAENIGNSSLYLTNGKSVYLLPPGIRKHLDPQNAETDPPKNLPLGDLYPA